MYVCGYMSCELMSSSKCVDKCVDIDKNMGTDIEFDTDIDTDIDQGIGTVLDIINICTHTCAWVYLRINATGIISRQVSFCMYKC